MGFGGIDDKANNKLRSWLIMEEYFDVAHRSMPVDFNWKKVLSPEQVRTMEEFIEKARKRQIERIRLN